MASRWMQQKRAIMARSKPAFDPSVTLRRPGHTIERSNALSAEIATLVKSYTGVVTKGPKGRAPTAIGKGRRAFDIGGCGPQLPKRGHDYYGMWSAASQWEIVRK